MGVVENIVQIRDKYGYLQEEVAEKLGITRQTYSKIEKGTNGVTLEQLKTLSELYGVPIEEFFYGIQNIEKFRQMYRFILSKFKETGIPKTKLAKLLYLSDFRHFYEHLEPMSGVLYKCKTYGPLADPFLELTDDLFDAGEIQISCLSMGAQMILPASVDETYDLLSEEEKKEMEEICELWRDINTQVIVNYTHHQKPWMACRENEVIPYTLILQEEPDHVYTPVTRIR